MTLKTVPHSRVPVLMVAWMALCSVVCTAPAGAADDKAAIRTLIGKTWDTPEQKVFTDPVVVDGDHAVAGWTQGARGGRALLHRRPDGWAVVLCSGDPLREAAVLIQSGVPEARAGKIAAALAAAESQADPERVHLFSTFEGVMQVGPDGAHPNHHDHH